MGYCRFAHCVDIGIIPVALHDAAIIRMLCVPIMFANGLGRYRAGLAIINKRKPRTCSMRMIELVLRTGGSSRRRLCGIDIHRFQPRWSERQAFISM